MFLLTTTHYLLAQDEQDHFFQVHSGRGLYYGIAEHENAIYVACRNNVEGPTDPASRAKEAGSVLVFDAASLLLIDELCPAGFPLRDVHGMAYIDGKLFVTCSHDNLAAIYDPAARQWTKWYPAVDPGDRDRDVHHFNTIAVAGGRIGVLAHNNGPSQLFFYDKNSLELCSVLALGCQAHDIFPHARGLATCSSGDGVLLDDAGWVLRVGGFPRGIAFDDDCILVGVSSVASRSTRRDMSGVVRRFMPDWTHVADYVLNRVGMVLAIHRLARQSASISHLAPFSDTERFVRTYNRNEPGNVYAPGIAGSRSGVVGPEWHAAEGTRRWTAARDARMAIVVNPGETQVSVTAESSFTGPYSVEIRLNGATLGEMRWSAPGRISSEFTLLPGTQGENVVLFSVPHLWQPSACYPGSQDQRWLGISIVQVSLVT
jgi:hypothetical protein